MFILISHSMFQIPQCSNNIYFNLEIVNQQIFNQKTAIKFINEMFQIITLFLMSLENHHKDV